jgi:hypothetical protein
VRTAKPLAGALVGALNYNSVRMNREDVAVALQLERRLRSFSQPFHHSAHVADDFHFFSFCGSGFWPSLCLTI